MIDSSAPRNSTSERQDGQHQRAGAVRCSAARQQQQQQPMQDSRRMSSLQIYAFCKACMEEDQQRHCADVKISVP